MWHVQSLLSFHSYDIIISLLDWRQRGPIKAVLLVIIGWLVTQFSQKRLQEFF